MRAGVAPPGWYLTPRGLRVRVVGPADDPRYVAGEDHTGRAITLSIDLDLAIDAPPEVGLESLVDVARGSCGACGWTGALVERPRPAGPVWALPPHGDGLLCRGSGRTPAESEHLAVAAEGVWGSAVTSAERRVVIRQTSDLAWLERAYAEPGNQGEVQVELLKQRDALEAIRKLAGDGPRLRARRRMPVVRSRPGVRHALDALLADVAEAEKAQRLAEDRVRAQRSAFRRRAGVDPPAHMYPIPGPPRGPDPIVEVLSRDAAAAAAALVTVELDGLQDEARLLLREYHRCPLTDLDWTTERLAVAIVWGRPLTALGVLALSRALSRAAVDPVPWSRRLDPETSSAVLLAAAARVAELPELAPGARVVRQLALTSLTPLAPDHAGALAVRALRSLWAGGVRATLTLETE